MEKTVQQEDKLKILLDLKERVKELECLYAIEGFLAFSDKPLEATISDIVNIIPAAVRYSNIASARIVIKNTEFKSVKFHETEWKQEHDILVYGKKSGSLTIYYSENKTFHEEEKQLLEAICKRLGRYYERKYMEENLKESRAELELRVKVRTAEFTKTNEDLLNQINERNKIEKTFRESEERYRILFENNPIPMVIYDLETLRFLSVNDSALQHYGYSRKEVLSMTIKDIFLPEDIPALLDNVSKVTEGRDAAGIWRLLKKDKTIVFAEIISHTVNFTGRRAEIVLAIDVTERKKMEDTLRKQECFLLSVFASIQDGISVLDNKMNILRVNPTIEKWYAHAMPIVGKKCYEAYHGRLKPCKTCPTLRTLATKEVAREIVPKVGAQGQIDGWLELYSFPLIDQQTISLTGVIEYVRDISAEMKTKEETSKLTEEVLRSNKRLKEISLTDPHTELYNYRFLENAIEAEFYRAKRYVQALSVIMVDIDYFKSVNDVYGHHFGDIVLKQFAKELKRMVRRYDYVIRSGGEEFIIVSPNIDRRQALGLAQRLLETLSLCSFGDNKHSVKLKLSMSVASYPEDKVKEGADLINLADRILEKAKELGGNRVYSAEDIGKAKKSSAVNNYSKNNEVKHLRNKIDKLTKKTNQGLVESILALAKTIELKDHTTGEHVEHTVHYVTGISRALGLNREESELVRQASILHDLGKIGISEKILNKKAKLNKKDYDEIKKHPQIAADILRPVQFLHGLIPFIFYHHERWDGKGYPSGIKGDEIPIGARIIAIADVYEALTSNRPYRKAYSKEKAIQIIKDGSGKQFDPRIVSVFLKVIETERK
ncbi:MAG: diguanylate cyclase [Candidatus Omnitrophota bacterium]